MKTFKKVAAQGDLLIIKIDELPKGLVKQQSETDRHVLAHSETGHHHVIESNDVDFYKIADNDMRSYIVVKGIIDKAIDHLRNFDTHESIAIPPGIYELRRQREYIPEGWRKVQD